MLQLDFGSVGGAGRDFATSGDSAQSEYKPEFSSTGALVRHLKAHHEDFEFYPTTPEILSCARADLKKYSESREDSDWPSCSVLDIGAGNGSALMQLTKGAKMAIELSRTLVEQMPADVFVVGSDFNSQSLVDKRADVIWCNPPYKHFSAWTTRIIREANSSLLYFVIPERWELDNDIQNAIKSRCSTSAIIGEFDFLDAERKARCKVHLVRIDLRGAYYQDRSLLSSSNPAVDPFGSWFDNEFLATITPDRSDAYLKRMEQVEETERLRSNAGLIESKGLVNMLSALYERELEELMVLYQSIIAMPADIAKELNIEQREIRNALQTKVKNLKAKYWRELFERIEALTTRLTTQHRQHMLEKLHSHTSVDFSVANVSSVLIWAIKQADKYTDSQLIALVEELTEESNVALYKRNQGTIKVGNWRYNRVIDIGPYKLDYSFILHDVGARSSRGINLLNDIVTVAITLGYDAQENFRTPMRQDSGKAELYYFTCRKTGKREVLFEARRYQNGNIHLKLNNAFLQKLNCKFGQLKGWLHSVADVVEEMDVTIEQAEEYLSVQLKLGSVSDPLLVLDLKAA